MNQMVKFSELFGKAAAFKLLEIFSRLPTTRFSQGQLIKKTKFAKATAIKALRLLESLDVVIVEKIGRSKLYSLNRTNWFVKQLKRFLNLTSEILQTFLKPIKRKLVKAIVFGSYAKGEDTEDSDIDILLVGDLEEKEIENLVSRTSSRYKKRISAIVRTQEQFVKMPKTEPVLWNKITYGGEIIHGT